MQLFGESSACQITITVYLIFAGTAIKAITVFIRNITISINRF